MTAEVVGPRRRHVAGLVVFVLAVAVVAVVGSLASVSAGEQYDALRQPSWAPPSWLFGPVWTVLYAMIAVAGWQVWRRAGLAAARGAMGAYGVQLVLNMLWTPLFFAAQWYGIALIEIVVLAVMIAVTIVLFARRDRIAAGLLVPYLAWTLFATSLNAAIWLLNM